MTFDQRIYDTLSKTEKHLYTRFGHCLELNTEQLAQFMGYRSAATVHTLISAGTFPIPTYKRGRHRYASLAHVARYQDTIEDEAVTSAADVLAAMDGPESAAKFRRTFNRAPLSSG